MAILTVAPACAPLVMHRGDCHLPLSKLFWISGCRSMRHAQSFSSAWSPLHPCKRRILIFPKASFIFETQLGSNLSEFEQSTISVFQSEAALLLPVSLAGESHTNSVLEGLLHGLPAISTEVSVAAFALLVGTSVGYLIAENMQKEESGVTEPPTEWLLITNSTPFNRFVLMRCPSIKFKDVDVYEGLLKKLAAEGHHVVRLHDANSDMTFWGGNSDCDRKSSEKEVEWVGPVLQNASYNNNVSGGQAGKESHTEENLPCYQRTFLHTEDGGVLAIDWPSDLEFSGEHGLDTTFLLVPGSLDGSRDKGIQDFVQRCVRHGYFPIVLNPRGCGGSSLTTPRLFTAGDSDDVRKAVEFILKSRPWATIMAVGWGYGADMLVKYLGEETTSTPVTAAVCIENTFDLEEANKLSQDKHVNLFDQKMTSDLVHILKSNQMLFEGKGRGFNVQKGLSAKTVRDFDEAISRVSKGYDDVHELYKDSSSKSWIDDVKIPVLCIQENVSIEKTFSIPRHVFEKNPFTTLILLLTKSGKPFSQNNAVGHNSLVIEWLAAVELAFLKGRHPLLQGIDVTFKIPLKERSFGRPSQSSQDGGEVPGRIMNQHTGTRRSDESSLNLLPSVNQRSEDFRLLYRGRYTEQTAAQNDSKALVKTSENSHGVEKEDLSSGDLSGSEKELQESSDTDASDDEVEQGQVVRQAAESVLKVLDVSMPGTLSEKQKEEVLEAVGRGETIVSALQEACPEDVREKMTTAVSAAVQARGISLKLAGFGKNIPAPKIPAGMVEKIQQKLSSLVHEKSPIASISAASGSLEAVGHGDQSNVSSQNEGVQKLAQDGFNMRQPESGTSVLPGGQTENGAANESSKAGSDAEQRGSQGHPYEKERQDVVSLVTEKEKRDIGVTPPNDENKTNKPDSSPAEKQGDSQQKSNGVEQTQESLEAEVSQANEPRAEKKNETATNSSADDHKKISPEQNGKEASPPQTPTPATSPAASLPSIDIGRAFEALTGVDDSTQMAVTNVFGVIENVLEQLEKEQGQKDGQMQQGQKDEPMEDGQKDEEFEQGQNHEHLEQTSSPIHESCVDGGDRDTEKLSSLQGEPYGDISRHVGRSEGTSSQECPGKGRGEPKKQLGQSQEIRTGDFDKQTDSDYLSNSSTASLSAQKSSSSDTEEEVDDANLALEYSEDENVWKLIDGSSDKIIRGEMTEGILDENTTVGNSKFDWGMEENGVTDRHYIIVDGELKHPGTPGVFLNGAVHDDGKPPEPSSGSFTSLVRPCRHPDIVPPLHTKIQELVMDALELELLRRLGSSHMGLLGSTLERDIEVVSSTVAETAGKGLESYPLDRADESDRQQILEKMIAMEDKVHVDTIISAVNGIYGELTVLSSVLPVGVLFGIVLTALSPLGIISTFDAQDSEKFVQTQREHSSSRNSLSPVQSSQKPKFFEQSYGRDGISSRRQFLTKPQENYEHNERKDQKEAMDGGSSNKGVKLSSGAENCDKKPPSTEKGTSTNNVMGAVAVAVGATAAIAGHENSRRSDQLNEKAGSQLKNDDVASNVRESDDEESDMDESKSSIVSSLAEKAMSVAAPVVPTKRDGRVDQERLVEMLAGLGQKGGILRFVGKVALLWGGLRGAMSLTDRLLGFLHMSDRPLYQRIPGFMVMVVLLWSPVLVPLLPALLQQWASGSQNGIASTAALIGLYCAVVILINIWGKKIRSYEDPLHQYGVNLEPGLNLLFLLSGLTLGLSLVALVHLLGVSLHLIHLDWVPALSLNTSKSFLWNLACGWRNIQIMVQCFGINLAVSFVEELFFRSWLQKEISADLGVQKATLISGLAFSISHWSLPLMPGLWLLSYLLTGAKVRCNGDLTLAIGIHAGLMAGAQLINMYGQVKYGANASGWFISQQSADPFTGLIGVSVLGVLALIFYPWGSNVKERD